MFFDKGHRAPARQRYQRTARRMDKALPTRCREMGYEWRDAQVINLSSIGALLQIDALRPKVFVILDLPGIGPTHARVVWSARGQAGVQFMHTVNPDQVTA